MRLRVLDSFRGIFALMIVLLHANYQSHLFYLPLVRHGYLFVGFFFVLSGFVVSMAYLERVHDGRSLAGFLIRRIGRLWPLHAVILLAFVALVGLKALAGQLGLYASNPSYSGEAIIRFAIESWFLVQSLGNETVYWLNFPAWSISAELMAYVVFGVLCLMGRAMIAAAFMLVVLSGAAAWNLVDPGFGHFFGNGVHVAVCYFLLGHFCYRAWLKLRHMRLPHAGLVELGTVGLIVAQVWLVDHGALTYTVPIVFMAAILVFSFEAGPVSRLLTTPPFLALGAWSYSIYMLHALVYELISLAVGAIEARFGVTLHSPNGLDATARLIDFGSPWVMDVVVLGLAGLVLGLASMTYRAIELPGQTASKRLAARIEAGGARMVAQKP